MGIKLESSATSKNELNLESILLRSLFSCIYRRSNTWHPETYLESAAVSRLVILWSEWTEVYWNEVWQTAFLDHCIDNAHLEFNVSKEMHIPLLGIGQRLYLSNPSFLPSPFLEIILAPILRLLERVLNLIVFPKPDLLPLLRHYMLHESLPYMLRHELPDETWIPELTSYTKIFTAAH